MKKYLLIQLTDYKGGEIADLDIRDSLQDLFKTTILFERIVFSREIKSCTTFEEFSDKYYTWLIDNCDNNYGDGFHIYTIKEDNSTQCVPLKELKQEAPYVWKLVTEARDHDS